MLDGWVTHRIVAFENGEEAHDICPTCARYVPKTSARPQSCELAEDEG